MWQFAEACRGLKDACVELGIPVTGGNVSLYNQTGETAILPDAGGRGARRDRRRHPAYAVRRSSPPARRVLLLGETREELSGSEWAHVVHGHLGGLPPAVDLAAREGAGRAAPRGGRPGHQRARPLRRRPRPGAGRVGARATASARPGRRVEGDPFVALFSESAGRVLVTVPAARRRAADRAGRRHGVPVTALGEHRRRRARRSTAVRRSTSRLLRDTWTRTLPDALG